MTIFQKVLLDVGMLIDSVGQWVSKYFSLFFTYSDGTRTATQITGLSVIGIFCVVLPLVGLGIGIIRRLVKVRA